MFVVNWKDIPAWRELKSTCWVRNISRSENSRSAREGARRAGHYFEWVDVRCVSPETAMLRHKHELSEILYVLSCGKAVLEVDGRDYPLRRRDSVLLPPGCARSLKNLHRDQSLVFISIAIPNPPDSLKEVMVLDASDSTPAPVPAEPLIYNWEETEPDHKGHENTIWWHPLIFVKEIGFTMGMQVIPPEGPNDLHQHNYEMFYYIEEGEGRMRVGDEWADVREGHFIFVPPHTPHSCGSKFHDLQINTLCIAVAVPYDAGYVTFSVAEGVPVKEAA